MQRHWDEFTELWKSSDVKNLIQTQLGKKNLLPQNQPQRLLFEYWHD